MTTTYEGKMPADLLNVDHWVNWKYESNEDGKKTKVPYRADGKGKASSTDPESWTSYTHAVTACQLGGFDGIGFVVTGTGITGIDIDHCINPETRVIDHWAWYIVQKVNSYTEVTPSNEGLRIYLKGCLPENAKHTKSVTNDRNQPAKIESYDNVRYFTVTGVHVDGTPAEIEDRQRELDDLYNELFPQTNTENNKNVQRQPVNLDDTELLHKARSAKNGAAFEKLWNGDKSDYDNDDSRADFALCCMLAFWTNKDPARIDRLFRQSGCMRDKWDRPDYRERTIQNAIENTNETYCENSNTNHNIINGGVERNLDLKRDNLGTTSGQTEDNSKWGYYSARFDEVLKEAGKMSRRDIAETIGLSPTSDTFRKLVSRRIKEGKVRPYKGSPNILEWINRNYIVTSLTNNGHETYLPITLPLGLNQHVKIPSGSVVGVAGYTSAGKTAFLLEAAELNVLHQNMPVYYWYNEMSESRMVLRCEDFPLLIEAQQQGKFFPVKQAAFEFADVLEPNGINLIDYIDLDENLYMIGAEIKKLQERLDRGIVVFGQQKQKGKLFGYGGVMAAKLSNLYISLDTVSENENYMRGECEIAKAKDWERINPVHLFCHYHSGGKHGKLLMDGQWERRRQQY